MDQSIRLDLHRRKSVPEKWRAKKRPGSVNFRLVAARELSDLRGDAGYMNVQPRRFGFDPMRDIQVLCPMNRGGLGARSLNIELQRALNPRGEPKVEKFGTTFAVGDKIMQIENDYDKEVYNGDIGYVGAIDLELGEMTIAFDGRPVAYALGELDQIVLAYATTIHKSQGSEFPAVVIPVTTQHYMMLQRNLLYTGVTRGKRLVILLGQKKAVAIAVKNVSGRRRWSKLREWLNPVGFSVPRLIGA